MENLQQAQPAKPSYEEIFSMVFPETIQHDIQVNKDIIYIIGARIRDRTIKYLAGNLGGKRFVCRWYQQISLQFPTKEDPYRQLKVIRQSPNGLCARGRQNYPP